MNIKAVIFSIILSFTVAIHTFSDAKHVSPCVEPQKMTLEWLNWWFQYSPESINHPEILYNRAYYVHLAQEHLYHLIIKSQLRKELSNYKFNKGFLEIESGTLAALIAYASYSIANICKANESNYTNYCYILSVTAGLLSLNFLANGVHDVNKSYIYEDDIREKIEHDVQLITLLNL